MVMGCDVQLDCKMSVVMRKKESRRSVERCSFVFYSENIRIFIFEYIGRSQIAVVMHRATRAEFRAWCPMRAILWLMSCVGEPWIETTLARG
jgi:hypothetical protein